MTSPQEKQPREQSQEVKEEHDIRFLEGEEHLHFDGNVYEDWMKTTASPQHLQQQQQQTHEGLQAIELQTKKVATQPTFEVFRPTKLQVPPSKLESIGLPFEFELGKRMV